MLAQKLIGATTSVPATVSYIGNVTSTRTANTYTFNSTNIGGPGLIVFVVHAEGASGDAPSLSSLTVGGSSATIHTNGAGLTVAALASFRVIFGTTTNIVVNYTAGDTPNRMLLAIYRIQNNNSDTPVQTLNSYSASNRTSASLDFNSAGNAVGVFGATNSIGSSSFTWTNATEVFDTVLGSGTTMSGARRDTSTATVTVSAACSSSVINLSGALWR